jgi:hypothetical protein
MTTARDVAKESLTPHCVPMACPVRPAFAGMALAVLLNGAAPVASQAMLVYTASGAGISGSLGSQSFSNARWRLTANAEESLARFTNFTIPPVGTFQFWWLPSAPQLTLETTTDVLVADLLPSPSLQWIVLSGRFPVGPDPIRRPRRA